MYFCPSCNIELIKNTNPFGIYWSCPICTGKAISLSVIRQAIPEPIVGDFWRKVTSEVHPQKKACPACKKLMSEAPIAIDNEVLEYLDICRTCFFVWFDSDELEALPHVEIPEEVIETLPYEVRLAIAEYNIERIATLREKEIEAEQVKKEIAIDILVVSVVLFVLFK
ncbi:MAG: hypothetical protein JXA96_16020 [Sedimentisphaerales bacterium]|nr:hypothetical protein [Sedimentisphaerales bacterium]